MSELTYADEMDAGVVNLKDHATIDKITKHITYDASKVKLPDGWTLEMLNKAGNIVNDLSLCADAATAVIGREMRADDENLTTVDSTLDLGQIQINSQHHLRQQVGEEYLYGLSTTTTDFIHSEEAANWLETQRQSSISEAEKLFAQ